MQKERWEQGAGESQEHPKASERWVGVGEPQGRARDSRDSPVQLWHLGVTLPGAATGAEATVLRCGWDTSTALSTSCRVCQSTKHKTQSTAMSMEQHQLMPKPGLAGKCHRT